MGRVGGVVRSRWSRLALLLSLGLLLQGPQVDVAQGIPVFFASENVEYLAHIPLNYDSPGARIVGDYLYLTTSRDLRIYDISEPANPQLTGELSFSQSPYFAQEDVDTNGEILLIGGSVINVEDKSAPKIIGTHRAPSHTITCVLDCKWAYAANGLIVDLRDPAHPAVVGDWTEGMPASTAHDVTEVAPGRIVTSSEPLLLLDARKDPSRPRLVAVGEQPQSTGSYIWHVHGNHWPRRARDSFLLTSGEGAGPRCEDSGAAFITWDARHWRETRTFRVIDEYRPKNGLPTEGKALVNHLCSHWFDPHPRFNDGGLVAMGYYDHGVRFLNVSDKGRIGEIGYFMRPGSAMSAAYWATDEIVYAVDYHYGLDVLRLNRGS